MICDREIYFIFIDQFGCLFIAYPGSTDPASHSFRGKTDRNAAMFDKAGTAYVYVIYGLYHCLNISSLGACPQRLVLISFEFSLFSDLKRNNLFMKFTFFVSEPGAGVLIRAIQPISGVDILRHFRAGGSTMKQSGLCSGPGRLCQALNITTSVFNKHDLHTGQSLWLEHDTVSSDFRVVEAPRIGINPKTHGEESVKRPWRYYVLGCPDVSRRDRQAELVHAPAAETVTAAAGNFGKMRKNSQRVGNKI